MRRFIVVSAIAFQWAADEIRREYQVLGHQLGWRFLCTPRKTLDASTPIALITANPGGSSIPLDHPEESCEGGSPYLNERWGTSVAGAHPLQRQIGRFFEEFAAASGRGLQDVPTLMNQALCAYFVPFRSPRLSDLHRPKESLAFGRRLWAELFRHLSPQLVVTIDRKTHKELRAILQQSFESGFLSSEELPTGWGTYTATLERIEKRGRALTLLRLPHLSTFRLFTSSKSRDKTVAIVHQAAESFARQ